MEYIQLKHPVNRIYAVCEFSCSPSGCDVTFVLTQGDALGCCTISPSG